MDNRYVSGMREVLTSEIKTDIKSQLTKAAEWKEIEILITQLESALRTNQGIVSKKDLFSFLENTEGYTYKDLKHFRSAKKYLEVYDKCNEIIKKLTGRLPIEYNLSYTDSNGQFHQINTRTLESSWVQLQGDELQLRGFGRDLKKAEEQLTKSNNFYAISSSLFYTRISDRFRKTNSYQNAKKQRAQSYQINYNKEVAKYYEKKRKEMPVWNPKNSGFSEKGFLAESWVRVQQILRSNYSKNIDKKPTIDYEQLFSSSMGSTPWYMGGDVGNIQVKDITSGARLASIGSLRDVTNFLSYIKTIVNNKDFDTAADKIANTLFPPGSSDEYRLQEVIENDLTNWTEQTILAGMNNIIP